MAVEEVHVRLRRKLDELFRAETWISTTRLIAGITLATAVSRL